MNLENADRLATSLGLTEPAVAGRMEIFGLTSDRRHELAEAWEQVQSRAPAFVESLYDVFMTVPHLKAVLTSQARVGKLKAIQAQYLKELIAEPMGRDYAMKRLFIGLVHQRIRITPQWYLASYAHYLCENVDPIMASSADANEARERIITLFQSILFDASLVLDAYGLEEEAQRFATSAKRNSHENNDHGKSAPDASQDSGQASSTAGSSMSHIRLTTEDTNDRSAFIGLTGVDIQRLRSLREPFAERSDEVLAAFYQYLVSSADYRRLIQPEQVGRLITQVRTYWQEFLEGSFDRPYAASRMRIGVIHERIGVTPQIYLAGLARQVAGYLRAVPIGRTDFSDVVKSFFRALMFDVTFVIDAYMEARGQTLLRTEGYAKELMAALRSSVVVIDQDSRIQFANNEFVSLVGIDPPMLCKMQLSDVLTMPELITEIESARAYASAKLSGLHQLGRHVFRVSTMKLEQQNGHNHGFLAVVLDDVSDLLRLSGDLDQNESLHNNLANSVSAVLWEMDFETKTIEKISRHVLELTGLRDEKFLGKVAAWFNCIVEEDRERFFVCCATVKLGDRATCDYRIRRSDGSEVWVRSYLTRPASLASTVRIVAVTVDITQPVRAEKLRFDAIGQVSGGIAHVINNCLTVIVNNIELQASALGGLAEFPFLQDSLKACQQAATVSKKLQAFAGGQMLRPNTVLLAECLKNYASVLQAQVGEAIEIQLAITTQEWHCRVDVPQLQVALEHICSNARDAMPMGGTITIAICDVPLHALSFDDPGFNRDWVQLTITDTGCGMAENVRRRAVEPFFGTYNLAERKGLGLSFVYGFVSQSGGHLLLQSQLGAGTSVVLRFPRHHQASDVAQARSDDASKPLVLVVDDDEGVCQSIAMQARFMGLAAKTALNETEAMIQLRQATVDVLLMDVVLGQGSDGVELAKRIAGLYPNIKVIIMSGYVQDYLADKGLRTTWQFLPKPFSAQTLRAAFTAVGIPVALPSQSSPPRA